MQHHPHVTPGVFIASTIDCNDDAHRCTPESEVLHERFGSFCLIFALDTHQLPHVLGDFDSSTHICLVQVRWQILLLGINLVLQGPTAAGATQVLQGSFRQGVQAGTRHHIEVPRLRVAPGGCQVGGGQNFLEQLQGHWVRQKGPAGVAQL